MQDYLTITPSSSSEASFLASTVLGQHTTDAFKAALYRSRIVLNSGDTDLIQGFNWCTGITSWQLVPLITALLLLAMAIPYALTVASKGLNALVRVFFATVAMVHVSENE